MSTKAHLGGHPDGSLTVPMPDEWVEPPAVVYAHKLSEAGRYLSEFPGVFGVPFQLVSRDDGTPVVLPDGSVEYWHDPSAGPVRPDEEPT